MFGQAEWGFARHWTGILGLRYTHDEREIDATVPAAGACATHAVRLCGGPPRLRQRVGQDRAGLQADGSRFCCYAAVSRGAKGGGWSAPTAGLIVPESLPYEPETLTSYEAGYKSTFLNGAARLNGALFYYDYHNYQAFFLQGLTQVVANRDARVRGGELELAIVPSRD